MSQKIRYLLWKDLLIRKNHYIATALEFIIPIVLVILANVTIPEHSYAVDNDPISFEAYEDGKCVPRHSAFDNIVYEPSTPFTDALMTKAACYAGYKKANVKAGKLNDENVNFTIGVQFNEVPENSSATPETLSYALFPTSKVWAYMLKLWKHSNVFTLTYTVPILHQVIELQRAIDISYIYLQKSFSAPKVNLENTDLVYKGPNIYSFAVHLSLIMAFTLMVPPIISRIVQEKSTGAKELMLMMGVDKWQLWVAKFIDVLLILFISISGMVIFLYVPLKEGASTMKAKPFFFWCLLMYGMIGVTFFLFFMSCFFKRATLAVYATQLIWLVPFIVSCLPSSVVDIPAVIIYFMCLFPHIVLMKGVSVFLDFNFYEKSLNLTERMSGSEENLTLLNILIIMTFNNFLYIILTWYLENVKPGGYGIPKPYNFCFKKSYWMRRRILTSYNNSGPNNVSENFETVPSNLRAGVSIQGVSKVYKTLHKGTVTAVDCVSLDFYHGEISSLLGHNGAGKTSIFSMITGLTYPTSGRIIINGYDLAINANEARQSLGLCPQKDMLFNELSTVQMIKFFGVLKGLSHEEAATEASYLISKLKLENVRNTRTPKLSGGQKRKVSLAIALIGGSKVLVLDEPTSGLDPEIRREIWEILLGLRGTRTILLTTHFMEEADALSDRIAIMDHGQIKCYGSPMFLKSKFGKGYVLSVVVSDLDTKKSLIDFIKRSISSAKFKSHNIRTLNFQLPENEVHAFPQLLSGLEEKQKNNKITSYSISLATIEDVFLRMRSLETMDNLDNVDSPSYKKLEMEELPSSKVSGCCLCLYQFWALIVKKCILLGRSYITFIVYCVAPVLIILLMNYLSGQVFSAKKDIDLSSVRSLNYSLALYSPSLVLYSGLEDDYKRQTFSELVESFGSDAREVDSVKDAIYKIFKEDFYVYVKKLNLAVDFSKPETNISYNSEALHMLPVSLNVIHNYLLKLLLKNSSIDTSLSFKFANKEPLFRIRPQVQCNIEEMPNFSGCQTFFYLLGVINERFYGAKGMQLMIISVPLYWLSHILFDTLSFSLYIFPVFLGLKFYLNDEFMFEHAGEILCGLVLWGCGLILLAYAISTFVKNIAGAFTLNMIIYIIFTFIVYQLIVFNGDWWEYVQYLYPSTMLKYGFYSLCSGQKSYYILALCIYDLVLFLFLIAKDYNIWENLFHRITNALLEIKYSTKDAKDEYVKEEEEVVKKKLTNKEDIFAAALLVSELKRWFFKRCRPSPAVQGVSFAVNRGECFGLLGVNGAGKTSTFRMLTGSLPSSHGSAYACSWKLTFFKRRKYLLSIGYCPQSGGLIPAFTGKEVLELFARLRGVRKSSVRQEVRRWLEKMNLLEYRKQKCGTYSGGNQRKLSTAMALIGDCPLIFLDEPTSGVDPMSRRAIWDTIESIQKKGQSVVLTSHSMEECEALCSRLAIMVNGKFRCIGETTTLKDRYGQGYSVQLKLSNNASEEAIQSLKQNFLSTFGSTCELVDQHLTVIQYHVKNKTISWADLFSKLNSMKKNFSILESYTASATTLEQIFISFARNG